MYSVLVCKTSIYCLNGIRTTAKHTACVREQCACSDAIKELSWDVSQDRRSWKNKQMLITTIESELPGANRHQNSIGNVSSLASCQVWEAGLGHCESSKHPRKFRVGTLNVNTERKSL